MRSRRPLRDGIALAATTLAIGAVAGGACRAPTQVTLDVSFQGAPCDLLGSVAIVVDDDATQAERRIAMDDYSTVTGGCVGPDGHVGTLVLTPSESGRAAIIVVGGLAGTKTTTCKPENGYFGCIVARRTFSFVEASPLTLPVVLDFSCANVPCDAISTCAKGACVSSSVEPDGDVFAPPGRPQADGAVPYVDAPVSNDAPPIILDDSGNVVDAGPDVSIDPPDAPLDAITTDSGSCTLHDVATVQCPTVGPCTGPLLCAYGPGGDGSATYTCGNGSYMNYRCAGSENCPAGQVCCTGTYFNDGGGPYPGPYGGGSCQPAASGCTGYQQLCRSDCECIPGKKCLSAGGATPGMATCQ